MGPVGRTAALFPATNSRFPTRKAKLGRPTQHPVFIKESQKIHMSCGIHCNQEEILPNKL